MSKKALVSGYIGFSNFGDDVIFAILTRHLRAKGVEVKALSANPKATKEEFKVDAYNYKNPIQIIKAILECDYLISGGGSLLQNTTSNKSLIYYITIIILAKLFSKKVIIFAQGIGPIYGNFWQSLVKFTLSICDLVTLRDKYSYKLLGKWKIKSNLVYDPAWDIPLNVKENRGYVGVQLRSYSHMHEDFIKTLAKYIGIYFSDRTVLILPFQKTQDGEICYRFERELKTQYPKMRTELMGNTKIKSIIENFANIDYLFAMRFHACLLGLKYGARVMALSYDIKVENLAKDFELQCINVAEIPSDYNETFRRYIEFKEHKEITQKRSTTFDWSVIDKFILS